MKIFLIVVVFALSQAQVPQSLISSDTPFTDGATVRLQPDPECARIYEMREDFRTTQEREKLKRCAPNKIETGTLNGVVYTFYYTDGSGMFAGSRGNTLQVLEPIDSNWLVGCKKDTMTDEKSCYMDRGDVRIWVDAPGRSEIYIGNNHYPGSLVVIRIDKGAPLAISSRSFDGSFGFRSSPAIIKQISQAKVVSTRYQKWPYRDYIDQSWEPYGFNEALQYIRWAVKHIR
jgi:hypothetical protein